MLAFSGCETREIELPAAEPQFSGVQIDLWPYFSRFEQEALKRGLYYDLNDLELRGDIRDLAGESVAGQCNFNHNRPNEILIDAAFWASAPDIWREFVVFHELGHCVLNRDHTERANLDGSCRSIMRSGNGFCWDNYNDNTRNTYLDELYFGQ